MSYSESIKGQTGFQPEDTAFVANVKHRGG